MARTELVTDAEALRSVLDRLNDDGVDPTVSGIDDNGQAFLVSLEGPYADREEVLFGTPWSGERDWVTGVRCEDCGAHHTFVTDDLAYPVTILVQEVG